MTAPQVSEAVATPFRLVLMSAGHSSTTLAGQVRAGGVVSRTVRVWTRAGAVAAGVGGGPGAADDLGAAATVADAVAVGDGDRAAGIRAVATPFALVLMSAGHSRIGIGRARSSSAGWCRAR